MSDRISIDEYRQIIASPNATPSAPSADKKTRRRKQGATPKRKPKERPSFLSAIVRLMAYRKPSNLRLKPEEQLSIDFADALRQETLAGRLICVWTHPANEIAGRRDGKAQIRYAIAKAMGLIDGTADYLFLWATGSGVLEAKVGSNRQQPNQVDFEVWCEEMGIPYATFSSAKEGLDILATWGALKTDRITAL